MRCRLHKEYKAILPPKAKCLPCWQMYLEVNPRSTVNGGEINKILESLVYYIDRQITIFGRAGV